MSEQRNPCCPWCGVVAKSSIDSIGRFYLEASHLSTCCIALDTYSVAFATKEAAIAAWNKTQEVEERKARDRALIEEAWEAARKSDYRNDYYASLSGFLKEKGLTDEE